uniref:Copia protein n=1 Tax=Cajanus cajan TaxID=3821 RepID=A0A151T553_CAJCA|nr:Copia protein [Cajanus cajan]
MSTSVQPSNGNLVLLNINTHHTKAFWVLDSSATDHISSSLSHFFTYSLIKPIAVKLPNGDHVYATHSGVIKFSDQFVLSNVLSNFTFNLISISKLVSSLHCKLTFLPNSCFIQDLNTLKKIGIVEMSNGLYILNARPVTNPPSCSVVTHPDFSIIPIYLWHFRLGHPSCKHLESMIKQYPFITFNKEFTCSSCHFSKQKRLTFPLSISKTSKPFELIHIDIWGPSSVTSMFEHRFFFTIVDDFTRYTWVSLMSSKAETRKNIINFIAHVERQFDTKVNTK